MGIVKEVFSSGLTRSDFKADFVRAPAAGSTEQKVAKPIRAGNYAPTENKAQPRRWNPQLSRAFDVDRIAEPATVMFDWISKHLDCQVRDLHICTAHVPSVRMGSFLTGMKHALLPHPRKAVRNFLDDGREAPPVHEVIQLNSTSSDDFLIEGTAFHESAEGKMVIRYDPTFYGIRIEIYTDFAHAPMGQGILDRSWQWRPSTSHRPEENRHEADKASKKRVSS